jgi:hypothetical protein
LLEAFGELPANGAVIDLCGLGFTVDGVEHNRITRVLVERLPEPEAPAETVDTGEVTAIVPEAAAVGRPEPAGSQPREPAQREGA